MDTYNGTVPMLIWLLQLVAGAVLSEPCHFPAEWQGHWFQSGIGDITISHNSITRKGICKDRHRDYYLMENTEEHCHQCLLVLPRHRNILQYKESYCIGRDSLQSICAQIRVEAILNTLVREPSYPVPCPIHNAFFVTYNNNSGGFCRSPLSYVHQCASTALFHFQFRQCQHSAYTYEKELDFLCLATWKDGSDNFLYGMFSAPEFMNKDDMYRCLIYSAFGTIVLMSVSADPTCRGVRTPQDGPMVMELTQDVFGWPEAKCRYPRWLVANDWRDLSGRYHYVIEPAGRTITSYTSADNRTNFQSSYHCISTNSFNRTHEEGFIALVHVLDHCESQFLCIKVKETFSNMVKIHLGDYVTDKTVTCTEQHFRSTDVRMLIPDSMQPVECPYHGRFSSPLDPANCHTEMRSSCDVDYSLDISSSCHVKPVLQLQCLSWWDVGNNRIMLLAQDYSSGVINCFSLAEKGEYLIFGPDPLCNIGGSAILLHKTKFTFRISPESCTTVAPSPAIRDVKHLGDSQDDDPGGGYLHDKVTPATEGTDFTRQTSNFKPLFSSAPVARSRHLYLIVCLAAFLWRGFISCVR